MADETILPGADVTENPAPAGEPGAGAEPQTPAPVATVEEPITPAAAKDDFSSAFSAAREKAAAADPEPEPAAAAVEEPSQDPAPAEDDDTIPSDEADADKPEAETSETAEAGKETASETADDKAAKAKEPDARTRKYKEVVEENTQLQEQRSRLDTLEQQFETHGGVDVVETAMNLYSKLAEGKALDVVNELPKHQRQNFVSEIFSDALANETNRVFGVNHVLKSDFGLEHDLSGPTLEKVFEFVTARLNEGAEDFEGWLDRELQFRNTPENQLKRVQAENERLKNPEQQPTTADTASTETPSDFAERMNGVFEQFEDESFQSEAAPKFADYGLMVLANDTPEIKEAKETLQTAVRSTVFEQMRKAKAFKPLIPYMVEGDVESSFYGQAKSAYDRALKAKTDTLLKAVSRLLGKAEPVIPTPTPTTTTKKTAVTQIPAPGGKTALPAAKPKPEQGVGFGKAFSNARDNAGTR